MKFPKKTIIALVAALGLSSAVGFAWATRDYAKARYYKHQIEKKSAEWRPKDDYSELGKYLGKLRALGRPAVGAYIDLAMKKSEIQDNAIKALGEIGDRRAVKPLIKTLSDEDPYIRALTARALGKIGDKRAVEPLVPLLDDSEEYYLEGSYVRGYLLRNNLSISGTVSEHAAAALQQLGDPRAARYLKDKKTRDGVIEKITENEGLLIYY